MGDWSPTKTVIARSFGEAISLLRSRELDLSRTASCSIVSKGRWFRRIVTFRFVRGGFHITAEAAGTALLVLRVQYSTCWRAMTSAATAPRMALQRVNGFQTLLRFSVQVDADFEFAFGLFDDTGCRSRDAVELKSLGVN